MIGVAVFRERAKPTPPPAVLKSGIVARRRCSGGASAVGRGERVHGRCASGRADEAQAKEQRLGTGHGRNEHSPTWYTDFERAQATPDELVAIHYESRDNLIAMGVIPRPRPMPNPFPATAGFVPDPPRTYRRTVLCLRGGDRRLSRERSAGACRGQNRPP